jgi:hypothetical protein
MLDHGFWFFYFTQNYLEFNQIASFFLICVWLVPFAYFISLSAGENSLPYGTISASNLLLIFILTEKLEKLSHTQLEANERENEPRLSCSS